MFNNGSNNQNRRNNNQRRNNNRGGAGKSNNRNGQPRQRSFDDENISPQQKRHFINKRDTHLSRGKELRAGGDRVEAENEFQHAEHYTRMIKIADDQQQKLMERRTAENPHQHTEQHVENNTENFADNMADEVMVSEGGNAEEQIRNEAKPRNNNRRTRNFPKPENVAGNAAEIAELPFMQPIPVAAEVISDEAK
jgi:hypothetical protein